MMAMRKKFNEKQNQLSLIKEGNKALTPNQAIREQTPNSNFEKQSQNHNRNNSVQLEDNISTKGIQLRIKSNLP